MYFKAIEIENYKCFKNKTLLLLGQGLNVIVGKNNIGKTALLEALSLRFPDKPYRDTATFPSADQKPFTHSSVTVTFSLTIDEVKRLILSLQNSGDYQFRIPLDTEYELSSKNEDKLDKNFQDAAGKTHASNFFSSKLFTFKLQRTASGETTANWDVLDDTYVSPKFSRVETNDGKTQQYVDFRINPSSREFEYKETMNVSGGGKNFRQDFPRLLTRRMCESADEFGRYIYDFRAERTPHGVCSLGDKRKLESDSSNLAEVLHHYLNNTAQSNKYNSLVRQIIPNVHQVSVETYRESNDTKASVVVWNSKKASERDHLSFPLADVGSGVSQILAILYVILTSEDPQIILIDEPQSFLHPDASRKLIETLKRFGKNHQIIIATHSPTIITSAEPESITLIRQNRGRSNLKNIDIARVESQRTYLSEIGAKLSDVFGYDKVIWVEGITEEICFPKILRKIKKKSLLGIAILEVHGVGEFRQVKNKDIARIVDIYKKLSEGGGGLVPEAVGFIFDRDDYPDEQIERWQKDNPELQFTKKRNYECYLLNAEAISFVINRLEGKTIINRNQIRDWFEENKTKKKYYTPLLLPKDSHNWTDTIHGKRFLKDLFKEFCTTTDNRNYKEKVHSMMLTDWLLKYSPNDLAEIAELVANVGKS